MSIFLLLSVLAMARTCLFLTFHSSISNCHPMICGKHGHWRNTCSVAYDILIQTWGGISWETNEERLKEYFSTYGEAVEVIITKDRTTGRVRGFDFIVFSDSSFVDRVTEEKQKVDGRMFGGVPIIGARVPKARIWLGLGMLGVRWRVCQVCNHVKHRLNGAHMNR